MRSAPPLTIGVAHFGVWRTIVALLAGSACASMMFWWRAQPLPVPLGAGAAAVSGSLAAVAIALTLWRTLPLTLRWDRQRWWLARGGGAERSGELALAIDLGGWLLLRFVADAEPGRGSTWRLRFPTWIALQRSGLEAPWHAIRCALHAARPALAPEGAALSVGRRET